MKKIITLILLITILVSCGKTETTNETAKKDFIIQTKSLGSFGGNGNIEKSGQIQGKNDIAISSQAIGRVGKILVKQGDKVKAGQLLVQLNDTIANYAINLQKANNTVEKSQLNYNSTKVTLDKQIFDSEIALEKLQNSLSTLKTTSSIEISQAKDNLENSGYGNLDSKSALELQKIDNSIAKNELDYNNSLISNKQTVETYKNSVKNSFLTQKIFLSDIINFGDKLFNISGIYKDDVKVFEELFGAKDLSLRSNTKQQLITLNQIKQNKVDIIDIDNISEEQILEYIKLIDSNYTSIENFLNSLESTLNNSIVSIGQLSQSQLDSYLTVTNTYQSQLTVNSSSFVSFKNSATNFLNTYKNTQESLVKQIELLKEDRNIYLKNSTLGENQSQNTLDKLVSSTQDNINSLELQIKQAQESIKISKESRDINLRLLKNNIDDAIIAKNVAQKDYDKLYVKAAIDGVVGDVLVDEGQDVSTSTPLLSVISDKASEVELSFKENELKSISVGDNVFTKIGEKSLTGSIYSISSVSDDSLNYKVLAIFNEKIQNLGGVTKVIIPIESNSILLPLEYVTLTGTNKGILNIYNNGKIEKKEVYLGKMFNNSIEFESFVDLTETNKEILIITSDISNFDENKYTIKLEQ